MKLRGACVAVLLLLTGCAVSQTWINPDLTPPPAPAASSDTPAMSDAIDTTLFLIGDAGKPLIDQPEPVLEALVAEVQAARPERSTIVYLGDNIYPDGVPENPDSKKWRNAEAALAVQVEASIRSGAESIFLPGNHDHGSGGVEGLERQRQLIDAYDNPRVRLLPEPGCPGPEVVDVGETLRLVLLDTQWWIAEKRRIDTPASCDNRTPDDIAAAVQLALATAGDRHCVVLAHHPLATHGAHGGFFSWREHLFPLVRWKSWMWIPIPILSSMYVGVRVYGGYAQDLGGSHYKEMIQRLSESYADHPPLFHGGGHEHSLQLLTGSHNTQYNLVSGAGTVKRPDEVGTGDDTIFVSPRAGFMRLDLMRDGRVRLGVTEVTRDNVITRPYHVWLREEKTLGNNPR